jgi:hypothetical protein
MNQIYIISDGTNIKVGFSKHPEKRLKQLATGHPTNLVLVYSKPCQKAREVEKRLHTMLNRFRCKRKSEWFKMRAEEWLIKYIDELIQSANRIGNKKLLSLVGFAVTYGQKMKTFRNWFEENLTDQIDTIVEDGADEETIGIFLYSEYIELFNKYSECIWRIVRIFAKEQGYENAIEYLNTYDCCEVFYEYKQFQTFMVQLACELLAKQLQKEKHEQLI